MKKFSFVLIVALALLLVGCETIDDREFTVEKVVTGNDIVDIALIPTFVKNYLGDGTNEYQVVIHNTSDSVVKIDWSKSSISYGGGIYLPCINGQKFADRNNPMPPSVIVPNVTMNIGFISSEQLYYTTEWLIFPIPYYNTMVTICVEYNGEDTYYTFYVNA